MTVLETPAPDDLTVDLSIDIQDLAGVSIDEIDVNQQFVVVVSVQDTRSGIPVDEMGIAAAYLDILYNRELVLPVFDPTNPRGFDITFSTNYVNAKSGNADTSGIIDEVGAFQAGGAPLGDGLLEVFRITFTANAAGVVEFTGNPADNSPIHDTLYFEPPESVDISDINYGLGRADDYRPRRK